MVASDSIKVLPGMDQQALHFGSGLRTVSAASGLLLVLFLLLHLAGVALAPLAPQRFEDYAAALHRSAWLPAAELVLLAVGVVHLGLSLLRVALDRAAGNTANLRSRRTGPLAPLAAMAARSQAGVGVLLLGFLVVHLAQLRWPRPLAGAELAALAAVLASPWSLALDLAAALALALHLFNGDEAAYDAGLFTDVMNMHISRFNSK